MRTLNNEYYPLLITQTKRPLKFQNFLKVSNFFESLLDLLSNKLLGVKIRSENQKQTKRVQ